MDYEWINIFMVFVMLHILGTAIGAGAAFTGDFIFLNACRNKIITLDQVRILNLIGLFVWLGLFILLVSGIGLYFERPDIYWHSGKFWAKMTIVGILSVNGLFFLLMHRPLMEKASGKKFSASLDLIKKRNLIAVSGAISVVSWSFAIILGVLGRTPFSYFQFMAFYTATLFVALIFSFFITRKLLSP